MASRVRSGLDRAVALLQIVLLLAAGCTGSALPPVPGAAEYQEPGLVRVPGGVVNAAGGNLMIERTDLTLDTAVAGTLALGAVYNSSAPGWTWSFGISYDGFAFLDPSGRHQDVTAVAPGAAIPGTHWVRVDADTLQTKGGLAHDFDVQGRLAAVHWATLDYPRLRHAWSDSSLEIAQCTAATVCTGFLRVDLDAQGRPLGATDLRGGRQAELVWDAAGRLAAARGPGDVVTGGPGTRYEYDGAGRLTAITQPDGERIEYAYQSGGRILEVRQIGEGDPCHRFAFHAKGSDGLYRTLHTNPLGARTRLSFDAQGRLAEWQRVETAERRVLTWTGLRPASLTLESGARSTFAYADDDPIAIVDAAGNTIAIDYAPGALNQQSPRTRAVARVEDALGLVEARSYDATGRLARVTHGEGESVELAYNGVSLVSALTQPTGAVQTFPVYGQHGHWLQMDGAVSDQRGFDPVGNARVESAKGRRGGWLTRQFDPDRRLSALDVAATDASGVTGTGLITIERRSDGQITAIRRPYGGDHEMGYDALGRLAWQRERVDGAWETTAFEHDLMGNLTARTRPNGMREEWQYDGYGRPVRYRALRDGALEGEAVYAYQDGQLVSSFDSVRGAAETYGYDAAGRLVATTFGFGETRALAYDLRSRVTAETLAVGSQVLFDVAYQYDLANRLRRTIDRTGQQVLIDHVLADGQLVQTRYGNGLVRDYAWDEAGLLVSSQTLDAQGEVLESTAIARTGETNPLRLQVRVTTQTPLAATEEQYWLDAGEQLGDPGKRVFGWSAGSGDPRLYAYDELGNQTGVPGGASYVYNAERNRLLAAGAIGYSYDEAGFVVSRGGVPITWTATGRLASYGGASAVWDLSGRLVALDLGGTPRRFDLFGGRVESDAATGAVGALDLGEVSLGPLPGERTYWHLDFRGNVGFVSDDAGVVTSHHRYRPHGVDPDFAAGANRNTFLGKPEAGPFQLLGARVYDPEVGRFLSPDPVLTSTNQFAYTSGNPVAFSDADGLFEVTVKDVATSFRTIAVTAAVIAALPVSGTIVIGAATLGSLAGATAAVFGLGAYYYDGVADHLGADAVFFDSSMFSVGGIDGSPSPAHGGGGGGGGAPSRAGFVKKLEFSYAGHSIVTIMPAPSTYCSPVSFARPASSHRFLPFLLLVNLFAGLAWARGRRLPRR
jgi:RHS repeat-associated protein